MSKDFNLLSLHSDSDIHPRTWLCLRGDKLGNIVRALEKTILIKNGLNRTALSKLISSKYRCSTNTVGRILQGNTQYYPLPILLEMLKLSRNPKELTSQINKNTQYLKINSASAKPVKAAKRLNENLSKILGAFMADGSLSTQIVIASPLLNDLRNIELRLNNNKVKYSLGRAPSRNQFYISTQLNQGNIGDLTKLIRSCPKNLKIQTHFSVELTDEYKDSVGAFKNWITKEFDIQPHRFESKKNAWRVAFSNKILSRYFTNFFGVVPGPKTYTAFEPSIIRSSRLPIRKAFARGVLMFDGCVNKNNRILLSTVSNILHESIKEIWKNDHIQFGESLTRRRGRTEFCLFTAAGNKINKLLQYFESGTQKEKLMRWVSGDLNSKPIIVAKNNSLISTHKILKILKRIKKCDSEFLKEQFKCTHTTIRIYLKILKARGKITLSNQPNGINNYVSITTTVLLENRFHDLVFKRIRDKFYINENFSRFMEIHKATLSAWKTKKSRMPLYILREFCNILDIDYNKALQNVIKVDREIAEII